MWDFGPRPTRQSAARTPPAEQDEADGLQASPAIPMDFSRIPARSSPGTPLAPGVRRRLEDRLGEDLGGVRVHTGPEAARAARDLGAVAYTAGEAIVLGDTVNAARDEHLLAHEAAHVVQQRHASRLVPGLSNPADSAEQAAESAATGMGRATAVSGGAVAQIQRQTRESAVATQADAEAALTEYLQRVQHEQGGQTLHNSDLVKSVVSQLFIGDPRGMAAIQAWLAGAVPSTPAEFAHVVAGKLPGTIPADRLNKLRTASAKDVPDTRSKTAGDAAGALFVDSTVAPIVRGLKLPKETQKMVIDGAKSAVVAGLVSVVDTALAQAGVTGSAKDSIHSMIEGAIKQQPGKSMDRKQDGAGSPYAQVVPPSVAPPVPSAPGEKVFKSPAVRFDFSPAKPAPKPSAAPPAPSPAVSLAISKIDKLSLTPKEVRGTEQEGDYTLAAEFARDVAARLDEAQRAHTYTVDLTLKSIYGRVSDKATIFQQAQAIVFAMRDALPHHASAVGQIRIWVDGKVVYSFPLRPGD